MALPLLQAISGSLGVTITDDSVVVVAKKESVSIPAAQDKMMISTVIYSGNIREKVLAPIVSINRYLLQD